MKYLIIKLNFEVFYPLHSWVFFLVRFAIMLNYKGEIWLFMKVFWFLRIYLLFGPTECILEPFKKNQINYNTSLQRLKKIQSKINYLNF